MANDGSLNRVAKWRSIFAGWQLGTRPKGDPESDAVRDHREATILMRVEVNALVYLLITKGIFTIAEWQMVVQDEAEQYEAQLQARFPGMEATDDGMRLTLPAAAITMRGWKP